MVMLPQLSQAGASDWKSANCSLWAVFGPASLGMMPARARSAAVMSGAEPFAAPLEWPLPLAVWPLAPVGGADFFSSGFVLTEPPAEPEAALPVDFVDVFSAAGVFPATT